ncbi:MAG: phosphoribosylformylglycinamidine synthase, partial [Oscillospiraceae bacterium]|nr:phosphoribosylformylglycinamidine synthase [Oscillospiraceae bacterium]
MVVYRIYVEKKPDCAVEAAGVLADLRTALGMEQVESVRVINRYDAEGLSAQDFEQARFAVFAEPQVDLVYDQLPQTNDRVFAVEYLPGQYDQRADSAAQCIQIMTCRERPRVATARVYLIGGQLSDQDFARIKAYLINPVESREASLAEVETLDVKYALPQTVDTIEGFIAMDDKALEEFLSSRGLAMDMDDLRFCQKYFKEQEQRDPTITEIRLIDTYWSDHCRHTTFLTNIDDIEAEGLLAESRDRYYTLREKLGRTEKPVTLMDMALIGAKALKAEGLLPDLDESEEINACSVKVKVDVDGEDQDWLLMFKNETHNHPTEIEPFGGAATCLGGAIRDPLSGRSYVYQAMRVTGAGDPLVPVADTLPGKLPQRKIVTTAAAGYSSYGNQIGLATGHVAEVYHPGYVAKRMEIGAVLGAAPAANVRRERPEPGDVVILLGGKTGRDGCGGATGSSKSHTAHSLESCGAEVQKGNPPEERKLQRLFRDPAVTGMIKRCNDFGAGGVSVAIGELADGLTIDLNKVPKKYDGLDGTELAISESQERMAVVIAAQDAEAFIAAADRENLDATLVARVVEDPRMTMTWNGNTIVSLSRDFLNSNGAPKHTRVSLKAPAQPQWPQYSGSAAEKWKAHLSDLNVCSQKGLVERFDSTIGAASVLMPFGGAHQLTPSQAMAAKLPVLKGETKTCSLMAWGYDPRIASASPYHGAVSAVIESLVKVVIAGGSRKHAWFTYQEYFPRTQGDPQRWGLPAAALLGALDAQIGLEVGSIGGKDSMSGTFEDIDVPPTLVSFAVSTAKWDKIVSTELKKPGEKLYLFCPEVAPATGLPAFKDVCGVLDHAEELIASGRVSASWAVSYGGIAEGVFKMCVGNKLGFRFAKSMTDEELFRPMVGGLLLASAEELEGGLCIGEVTAEAAIALNGEKLDLEDLQQPWEQKLQPVFPYLLPTPKIMVPTHSYDKGGLRRAGASVVQPGVLIPVFPGTNCEYDTARAFERAGAKATIFVVRNRTAAQMEESVAEFAKLIGQNQIIALPGGISGGDEPDGSGKFITAFFRNPAVTEQVHELLNNRDGLMCGICNGFQALVKLGLVPFGRILETDDQCPTLTFNRIGRHQSNLVRTRVASNLS